MKPTVHIMWFRRDLRLTDNAALYYALRSGKPVLPVFIFDRNILDRLEDRADKRLVFIREALETLQEQLAVMGSSLRVYHGFPLEVFRELLQLYDVQAVYANHDYDPYALERETQVAALLRSHGTVLHTYKDQVIFEKAEVLKDDGKPYTVYTPYSKKWRATLQPFYYRAYPTEKYFSHFIKQQTIPIPSLESIGFAPVSCRFPARIPKDEIIRQYAATRDFPGLEAGTTKMGIHLRFGTVSIRQLVTTALAKSDVYLNELIWRDFYHAILWHFPQVGKGASFKPEYDRVLWRNNEAEFAAWCAGKTGYPIVDAGMRELNETGYMHNRVRMITASFLVKHLLIDWRWGEAYFAQKLLDYDLAANNGGWQWASSSGCDAAPYFRIFNPALQTEKFDKKLDYIRKWIPELDSFEYPRPIVVHEQARKRALDVYAKALKQ